MRQAFVALFLLVPGGIASAQVTGGQIGSLTPAQSTTGQPVPALPVVQKWQTFTDPNEGAFQVQMPVGWKDSGGLKRYDALQYRAWATAISPDGRTILALGDPNEPAYATPMMGFMPGSIYNATGTYYVVEPLQNAQQYVVNWGTRKLQGLCTAVKATGSRERPDVAQQLSGVASAMGISHDYGEANFTCQRNGVALTGYAFLGITVIRTTAYTALWYADSFTAFLAPTPVAGMAADLLGHMLTTLAANPQWVARQSQTAMNVSQIATQTNNIISNSIMQGWEQRSATMDQIMQEGSRERLGIDVYRDPDTGVEYVLGIGHQYYWCDGQGNVVGTDTDNRPGVGYTQLNRVPPS